MLPPEITELIITLGLQFSGQLLFIVYIFRLLHKVLHNHHVCDFEHAEVFHTEVSTIMISLQNIILCFSNYLLVTAIQQEVIPAAAMLSLTVNITLIKIVHI
jgi:hypothetical protein